MTEQRGSWAVRACLVDVWETVLTCVRDRLWRDVARVASTSPDGLRRAAERCAADVMVEEVVETWQKSLASTLSVFGDARSFLERRRDRGDVIALVSNCGHDTRPVLELAGLDRVADALGSCE